LKNLISIIEVTRGMYFILAVSCLKLRVLDFLACFSGKMSRRENGITRREYDLVIICLTQQVLFLISIKIYTESM